MTYTPETLRAAAAVVTLMIRNEGIALEDTEALVAACRAHADAWQARVEALTSLLNQALVAICSVPDKAIFGIGGTVTHWYLADELVSRIEAALAEDPQRGPDEA
jgi:hypothetical protein